MNAIMSSLSEMRLSGCIELLLSQKAVAGRISRLPAKRSKAREQPCRISASYLYLHQRARRVRLPPKLSSTGQQKAQIGLQGRYQRCRPKASRPRQRVRLPRPVRAWPCRRRLPRGRLVRLCADQRCRGNRPREHLVHGRPVERLRLPGTCINTEHCPHKPAPKRQVISACQRQISAWYIQFKVNDFF